MHIRPIGIMSFLLLVTTAGALGACSDATSAEPSAPSEGEDSADGTSSAPIVDGVRASAYYEAALVDMYRGGRQMAICSGAVIAPRVVLTAGHCIDGIDGWRVTTPFAQKQTSTSVGAAVYDWRSSGETVDPNLHDIGLVFLKTPIQLPSYPKLAAGKVPDGTRAINVGRIQNNNPSYTQLFQGRPITLRDGRAVGFPYSFASSEVIQSGDSGGPVFLADGSHTIVAVNSGAGGGTQVLARVDLLADWIQKKIAENGGNGTGGGAGGTTGGSTGGTSGGSTGGTSGGSTGGKPGGATCNGTVESGRNGSYGAADPITQVGQTICGEIGPRGDEESWFSFGLASSGIVYDVQVQGTGDAAVGVWKDTGSSYRRIDNDTAQRVRRESVSASKYLVAVFSPSGTPQKFTLKFDASR